MKANPDEFQAIAIGNKSKNGDIKKYIKKHRLQD
jgi:hypothetical protein